MSGMKRSRIRYEITCKHCQTVFTVPEYRKDTAMFCSRKSLGLASRQEKVANCAECGSQFTHISSRVNKAKYCSSVCYHRAMRKKGKTEYTCLHCNKKFMDAAAHKRKYCSKACVNKAEKSVWKAAFTTVRKNMLRRGMLLKCQHCGYDEHPEILGVHHKDRNRNNNTPENLEVLCANCHSLQHGKHIAH